MLGLSSPSRDQTHIPCIGRQILNHWTTKKVPGWLFEGLIPQQLPHLTFPPAVHKGSSVPTSSLAAVMVLTAATPVGYSGVLLWFSGRHQACGQVMRAAQWTPCSGSPQFFILFISISWRMQQNHTMQPWKKSNPLYTQHGWLSEQEAVGHNRGLSMGQSGKPTHPPCELSKGCHPWGQWWGMWEVSGVGSSLENPCVLVD